MEVVNTLRQAGFSAYDNRHHIAVATEFPGTEFAEWECAVLYIDEEQTLWVKVLAQRWWLLFTIGDRQQRYEALWEAIDTLEPRLSQFATLVGGNLKLGTIGELNLAQAFEDAHDRKPSPSELAALTAEVERLSQPP